MNIETSDAFEKIIQDMNKIITEKSKTLLLVAKQAVLNKLSETVEAVTDELQNFMINSLQDIKPILNQNAISNKNIKEQRQENLGPMQKRQGKTKKISIYECLKCGNSYESRRSLLKHEKRVHLEIKRLQCPECDYATDDRSRLDMHIEYRHPDHAGYCCSICEFSTCRKIDLKRHYRSVHDIKDCRSTNRIIADKAKRLEIDDSVLVTANDSASAKNETNPYKQEAFEYVDVNYS